jgi:hypothetical protein
MDRRKALKQIGLLSGGMVLLPSCDLSKENVSRVMNKLELNQAQDALLAELVDVIIPESEIPGAKALNVTEFVWVMVDDCLDQATQRSFLSGLEGFKGHFKEVNGYDFDSSDPVQSARGLEKVILSETTRETVQDVAAMIEVTKAFTILGFNKSEYIMTEVMPYSLIPGKNPECHSHDPNEKINANA